MKLSENITFSEKSEKCEKGISRHDRKRAARPRGPGHLAPGHERHGRGQAGKTGPALDSYYHCCGDRPRDDGGPGACSKCGV